MNPRITLRNKKNIKRRKLSKWKNKVIGKAK